MKCFKCGKETDREPNVDCKGNYPAELCDRCKVGMDSTVEADELKRIAEKDYDAAMKWAEECNMDNKFNVSNDPKADSGLKEEYNCYAMFDNDKPMLIAGGISKEGSLSIELKAMKAPHIMEGNNGKNIKVVAEIIFKSEEKKKFTLFMSNEDICHRNPERKGDTDE